MKIRALFRANDVSGSGPAPSRQRLIASFLAVFAAIPVACLIATSLMKLLPSPVQALLLLAMPIGALLAFAWLSRLISRRSHKPLRRAFLPSRESDHDNSP